MAVVVTNDILNAMRIRLIAKGIIPENRIQIKNVKFRKPEDGFWVRESINAGDIDRFTNVAAQQFAIVNYEVFSRSGVGSNDADSVIAAIAEEFWMKETISIASGVKATITKVSQPEGSVDISDPGWFRQVISFTMRIYLPLING